MKLEEFLHFPVYRISSFLRPKMIQFYDVFQSVVAEIIFGEQLRKSLEQFGGIDCFKFSWQGFFVTIYFCE